MNRLEKLLKEYLLLEKEKRKIQKRQDEIKEFLTKKFKHVDSYTLETKIGKISYSRVVRYFPAVKTMKDVPEELRNYFKENVGLNIPRTLKRDEKEKLYKRLTALKLVKESVFPKFTPTINEL